MCTSIECFYNNYIVNSLFFSPTKWLLEYVFTVFDKINLKRYQRCKDWLKKYKSVVLKMTNFSTSTN